MALLPTDVPPGHSTGPRTAEGKARSSQNSYKHGSCSNKLLLPGEDPQELQDVMAMWIDGYDPSTVSSMTLARETATAHWLLIRQRRRYNEAEQFIAGQQPDPMFWLPEQHKRLQLFMRYLNAAERAFHRNLAALEAFRGRRFREAQSVQRGEHRTAELDLKRQRHALSKHSSAAKNSPLAQTFPAQSSTPSTSPGQHSQRISHHTEPSTRPISYAQLR